MWSDNMLNRDVCGESSVMFIEGAPPPCLVGFFLRCEAIKKEEELGIAASKIDIYLQQEASPFSVSVLPIRCKSGWNLPPKSHCVFLALCVVRTLLFAGWRMDNADKNGG